MSYVIQNFHSINPNLILNQKVYLVWVLRNINLILTFILRDLNSSFSTKLCKTNFQVLNSLLATFYNKSLYVILKTIVKKWKSFIKLNFNSSLQYWIFSYGLDLLKSSSIITRVNMKLKSDSKLLHNQYFLTNTISNISLHNKHYRTVMLKFMSLILSNWQSWNRHFKISFKFVLGSKNFFFLRFYNCYFFKIYNF